MPSPPYNLFLLHLLHVHKYMRLQFVLHLGSLPLGANSMPALFISTRQSTGTDLNMHLDMESETIDSKREGEGC